MVLRDAVDRVLASGGRSVCLFGLSFKMDTDDLRESPNVELAERLIGKGYDVWIYDPLICPERLVGANRQEVMTRLPHVGRLLVSSPEEAMENVDIAVVSSNEPSVVAALLSARRRRASSTSTAGSGPRSRPSPATRGSAGDH